MPVIHECAPASPAAKKWHMANPPGVQLHACKCHNLKAATHFFWEAKKKKPVSRIDGLVASGVIGHFFSIHGYNAYTSKLSEMQRKQLVISSDFKSFQELFWFGYTFQLGIRRLGDCRFHDSLHSGEKWCLSFFVAPSHKNPCANDALALSKESSRALQPGGFSESLQASTKGEMKNSLQSSQLSENW